FDAQDAPELAGQYGRTQYVLMRRMRLKTIRNGQTRSGLFFCRGGGAVAVCLPFPQINGTDAEIMVGRNGRAGFSPSKPKCRLKPDKAPDAV
ncbi:hypothetical protein, partial [Neisseria polysaccharea]|uniref:hypothetical protein n=1 Tax=Neisseria polysaccharea TaxID=489 RepID=UPI00272A433C